MLGLTDRTVVIDTNMLVGAAIAELAPEYALREHHQDLQILNLVRPSAQILFSESTMVEFVQIFQDTQGRTRDLSGLCDVIKPSDRFNYIARRFPASFAQAPDI